MATPRQFATLAAGATSIFALHCFGFFNPPQTHSSMPSEDLGLLSSLLANLPANATSNATNVVPGNQHFLVSQVTGSSIRFVPPIDRNPRTTQGAGSRGSCEQLSSETENLVTLLIPSKDYVGQTTSAHPTFFWYLSKPVSVPMQFTLTQPGVTKPLYYTQLNSLGPGLIQLEIPKDSPELLSGQTYRWSVTLVCNSKRPSLNPFFSSWIQRVSTTPVLEKQLAAYRSNHSSTTESLHQRAIIYAEAGLWYDALTAVSMAQTANPNDPVVKADFLSLLNQVGLIQLIPHLKDGDVTSVVSSQ